MVLFTTKKVIVSSPVRAARGMPPIRFGVHFNILGIVVLADPGEQVTQVTPQQAPDEFGVSSIRELSDWGE